MANTPTGPRRHETRALLRAHLAAASGYRHATRHCPICHRLLRLAMESGPDLTADFTTGQVAPPDRPPLNADAIRASPETEPDTAEVAAVAAAVTAEAAKDAIPAAGSAGK